MKRFLVLTGALLVVSTGMAVWLVCSSCPIRVDPLHPDGGTVVIDANLALARRYAPHVYHEANPTGWRQDIPCNVDFDGDLVGNNNWDNMPHYALAPTLYYAVLETQTHWFITWHIFHPRDWSSVDIGIHTTHENDGENLQVVVDKATGRVVLLYTQAHYDGFAYANTGSGFGDAEISLTGGMTLVDDAGVPSADGTHACVFVEWGGHGIYAVGDKRAQVTIGKDGVPRFDEWGYVLRPARQGEAVAEPDLAATLNVPYRLESTTAKLWPLLRDGQLTGDGKLLDGALTYSDALLTVDVPRYYDGDRFSGPLGPDRGIAPFAVDFRFGKGEVGALFFNPTARYAAMLTVPEGWSTSYVNYPYVMPPR